jgi:hypothetical protein
MMFKVMCHQQKKGERLTEEYQLDWAFVVLPQFVVVCTESCIFYMGKRRPVRRMLNTTMGITVSNEASKMRRFVLQLIVDQFVVEEEICPASEYCCTVASYCLAIRRGDW